MNIKRIAGSGLALLALAWATIPAGAGQASAQQGGRLRERISELYLLRLTRALDLTEEQTAKVYPLLTRAERDKAALQREMGLDLRSLRDELARPEPRDKELLALVDRIRESRREVREKDEEVEAALDGILTPAQRARFLAFNIEFLRNVGENLGRARGLRGALKRSP